jgi:ABC-type polysaccharide/polyol phosphate transport system ATPase subunit
MSETLIKVENISKKFCKDLKRSLWYGMKDLGTEILGLSHDNDGKLRKDEFWAVKDVGFELKRGEFVGLIGRNGAGKTTILRMLTGLIKPDKGRIEMHGRVGALIALGAGFNPILTGRENIYVNAAVLGLGKKAIDAKFDQIVEFAELGEFIDTPVQSYSSGMAVRLGFSVSTALDPDVLLLDEVLAVGDIRFQAKCLKRIKTIRNEGGAILLVTHTLQQVAHFCDQVLLVDKGKLLFNGDTTEALSYYMNMLNNEPLKTNIDNPKQTLATKNNEDNFLHNPCYNPQETRWGDLAATITDVCLTQGGRECLATLSPGITIELILRICFYVDIEEPIYGLSIKSPKGGIIFNINSRELFGPLGVPPQKKGDQVELCFSFNPFLDAGEYLISVGIASETLSGIQPHDRRYDSIWLRIAHPLSSTGDVAMNPSIRFLN